nr:immunoglobulin light chain junction region [Macaca mulatta]MOW51531.1 immunoglobulin light chain junction region [Macaca mulatta]MOW51872.1 immunoglobulin light chain junction region [Macaca mulatta]MOW51928.1 immunoglobulin light chain junction region [Macaca mulatta]MOW52048.1 immunoglobulin light chain junction region [Macaca mulatta]
CMQAIQLPFTF